MKLQAIQRKHLLEYCKKYRVELLSNKKEGSDRLFISQRKGTNLQFVIGQILKKAQRLNPQVKNLYHIRTSVITHWRSEYGLYEAMTLCGHKHAKSTRRYETKKYDELQEKLNKLHPLEML